SHRKYLCAHRRTSVMNRCIGGQQCTGVDEKQREDQKEQHAFESSRPPVPHNKRQQEQVQQRPYSKRNQSNIEKCRHWSRWCRILLAPLFALQCPSVGKTLQYRKKLHISEIGKTKTHTRKLPNLPN